MLKRWRYRRRCRRLAQASTAPVLADYLRDCAGLQIRHIDDTPMIAADLELTGLDKNRDRIVALGWTLLDGGRIRFGSNRHLLVNSERSVGPSAAIHELLDSDLARGANLEDGLGELFEAARGRVWIFHHAGIDVAFLRRACTRWAGVAPPFVVLDTMRIEYRLRLRREVPIKRGDLQLARIRSRFGLPRHTAHNALTDAVATAEVMLALAASLEPDGPLALEPHLKFM